MRHYLLANIQRRREYLKANPIAASPKLLTVLPDYVVVYVIHLMAHDPLYEDPTDVEALNRIKECLWFQLEPHCSKNDNYSFSYFKKLLEGELFLLFFFLDKFVEFFSLTPSRIFSPFGYLGIKRSKDRQNPSNEAANHRLYAVCDLTLALIMNKTANFGLREVPQVSLVLLCKLESNLRILDVDDSS